MSEEKTTSGSGARRRANAEARSSSGDETDDETPTTADRADAPNNRARASRSPSRSTNGGRTNATTAAGRAARAVAELTGHDVETVISVEPCEDGWKIGVEVVETRRIPDSADILATYEVRVDAEAQLVSYRRAHRYARGQLYGGGR
jgi:hypothetical protein